MFFDWIYPTYSPILIRAVEIWAHDPSVTTPVLKFFGELVQNRSQRLVFDVSSPNGYLLFRETSKLICCYGNRILSIDVPKDQIYQMRFKGISVCFLMLKAILCGNYVNLGVFKLYGDNAFDSVMNTAAKLILSIPHKDLLVSFISKCLNGVLCNHERGLFRNIQNLARHITSSSNAWLRITSSSCQHWNQPFFFTFSRAFLRD